VDDVVPKERGSVRPVTIEGDDRSYTCEVRAAGRDGLKPGAIVWVEFGSYWTEERGEKTRHPGQWRQCIVLRSDTNTASGVHVRLSPAAGKTTDAFG
jgi:hypothetical protein